MARGKKAARKPLTKSVRFEVFKRDKFTCQYCGSKAPDVVLHVDHIHPVADGGGNDVLNLVTSCAGCNGGKGAKPLSDDSAVSRQRDQLAMLEERRQQIEMMVQWRQELAAQGDALVEAVAQAWTEAMPGSELNEVGRAKVAGMIKKSGFSVVMDAIESMHHKYCDLAQVSDPEYRGRAFKFFQSVAKYGNDPDGRQMAYVIGILKNRCSGPPRVFHSDLRNWRERGVSVGHMTDVAKVVDSWGEFSDLMEEAADANH
jgi:hypothetical protein